MKTLSAKKQKLLLSLVFACIFTTISIYATFSFIFNNTVKVYADGQELASITVRQGEFLSLPTPEKLGYVFAGWYKDTSFSEPFDVSITAVQHDINLYAKWIKNRYTITVIDPTDTNETISITNDWGTPFYFKKPLVMWMHGAFIGIASTYNNPSDKDIIAAKDIDTSIQHIPAQNMTYYLLWEDWKPELPVHTSETAQSVIVRFVLQKRLLIFDETVSSKLDEQFVTTDKLFTLPNVAGLDVPNNGLAYVTFKQWSLYSDSAIFRPNEEKFYRDGEHVDLGKVYENYDWAYIGSNIVITFYAQWNEIAI